MSAWRRRAGRLLLGLAVCGFVLGATEGAMRLAWGPPVAAHAMLYRELWDRDRDHWEVRDGMVSPIFQARDQIDPFPVAPTRGFPRVIVFGESSVRGGSSLPVAEEFPARLEALLRARGKPVEVINLGRPGMDSSGIRLLASESVGLHPTVYVVYAGHNDIGNAYMFSRFHDVGSVASARMRVLLDNLQLYAVLRNLVARPVESGRGVPSGEPPALTQAQRDVAASTFRQNLARMVFESQRSGVRVVLSTVISRMDVWSTTSPVCADGLPSGTWTSRGGRWELHPAQVDGKVARALPAALPDCPEAWYLSGEARLRDGDSGGMSDLEHARDIDAIPMRATSAIEAAIRDVGRDAGVPVVDIEDATRARYMEGGDLFIDNLHLSGHGHAYVAQELLPAVEAAIAKP